MKLPRAGKAKINKRKILDYLLSTKHPVGKSKAKFFRKVGFNETNIDWLEEELLSLAKTNGVTSIRATKYGKTMLYPDR